MKLVIEVEVEQGESPAVIAQFLRETAERLEGESQSPAIQQTVRMGFNGGAVVPVSENKGKIGFRKE